MTGQMSYVELYEDLVRTGETPDMAAAIVDQQVVTDARVPKIAKVAKVAKKNTNWYEAVVVRTGEKVAVQIEGQRVKIMNDVKVPAILSIEAAKAALRSIKMNGRPVVSNGNWTSKWDMWWNQ